MPHLFGNKKKFAIEYELLDNPHNEFGVLGKSWGELRLWVENKDICEYMFAGEIKHYTWNLYYLVDWLCNNLEYVIGFDPFPLPVQGNNVLELEEISNEFNSDDITEYLWYGARKKWYFRHSWMVNRDGSILSCVCFRRHDNFAEISWDNNFWDEGISFTYPKGVYVMPVEEFKDILISFLLTIIEELESKGGKSEETFSWLEKIKLVM